MGGSKRTFSYSLTPAPGDTERVASQVRKILGWACDGDKRIECHDVTGEALGTVTMTMTIVGRDQWWCRQLAQDLLNYVTWGLHNEVQTKLDLQSYRLDPHENRGYAHGRTKQYRQPKDPKAKTPPAAPSPPESADPTPGTEAPRG